MGEMQTGVVFAANDSAHFDTGLAAAANALGSLVDEVVEAEFVIGLAMARRAKAIERASKYSEGIAASPPAGRSTSPSAQSTVASRDMARRSFVAEIAAALRIQDRTADRLIQTSHTLVSELPSTLTALGDGRLSYRHAQILADNTYSLDPESVRELELRMLGVAEKKTPSQFERSVRRTRERLHPETMIERQVLADSERAVELMPERDGMVFIGGHVSSVLSVAIDERLTAIARSLQQKDVLGTVETRTLTQLKADVFTDLLLDVDGQEGLDGHPRTSAGTGIGPMSRYRSIRPKVLVTVPASTVLRLGGEPGQPGELEGYGPIDPQTAREITSLAKSWQKLLTDPVTGIVLRMGRKRYRIPKDLVSGYEYGMAPVDSRDAVAARFGVISITRLTGLLSMGDPTTTIWRTCAEGIMRSSTLATGASNSCRAASCGGLRRRASGMKPIRSSSWHPEAAS
jgi:hypothetical protein